MDPRELLALATARGIRIEHVPGGRAGLTGLDISAALARCSKLGAAMLAAKYQHDTVAENTANSLWCVAVMQHAFEEGWRGQFSRQKLLAEVSMAEWMDDNRCKTCKGAGSTEIDRLVVSCETCDGTGRRYASDRQMSARMQMWRKVYLATWRSRMNWCRAELERIESDAVLDMRTALY